MKMLREVRYNLKKHKYTVIYRVALLILLITSGTISFAQITVTGGTGLAGTYTSFTVAGGLFSALNGTGQTGNNIVVTITGNITTETGAVALNQGAWTSITITPSGARTVSGTAAGKPLFDFNGADKVTINGLNIGGNSLSITNTSTSAVAGTSTFRFINDATNNTLNNCTIKGAEQITTSGVIFLSSTTATTGNDNITISNCTITSDAATFPINLVYSAGTIAKTNDNVSLNNNSLTNFKTNAINIPGSGNSSLWNITNNSIYFPGTITPTSAMYGVNINTGSAYIINSNFIGGTSVNCGGGPLTINTSPNSVFTGIYLNTTVATTHSVKGNTISNITLTSTNTGSIPIFSGIDIAGSSSFEIGGLLLPNIIQQITITNNALSGSFGFTGINSIATGTVNVNYNTIKGINSNGTRTNADCYPIKINSSSGTYNIDNNIIGTISENITIATNSLFQGIANLGTANITCTNNTIQNINLTNTGNIVSFTGIYTLGGIATLTNDTIKNITYSGTNTSTAVSGIFLDVGTTSSTITHCYINGITSQTTTVTNILVYGIKSSVSFLAEKNFISGLINLSASVDAIIGGISFSNSADLINNIIILSNGANTNAIAIYGIEDVSSSNSTLYFNTIKLSGTGSSSTKGTSCYKRTSGGTDVLKNNLFQNLRSGGTFGNYATVADVVTTFTEDYNYYEVAENSNKLGKYLSVDKNFAAWITSTGGINSLNGNITINADATLSSYSSGTLIPGFSDDYYGTFRAATPAIGAVENSSIYKAEVYIGATLVGSYYTLSEAFSAINNGEHTGNLIVKITNSQSLVSAATLNYSGYGPCSYGSINIYPTISSVQITGTMNRAMISLFGADNITFDGRINGVGSTNDLNIVNTNTSSGAATIVLLNDASSNSILYCNLFCYNSNSGSNDGAVVLSNLGISSGNDNNSFSYCQLGSNDNTKPVGIGINSTSAFNSGTSITYCSIYNFKIKGLNLLGDNSLITNNSFYNTSTSFILTTSCYAIYNSCPTATITDNYIGGRDINCGGLPLTLTSTTSSTQFIGIFTNGNTGNISINNNTIQNIIYSQTASGSGNNGIIGISNVGSSNCNIGTNSSPNIIGNSTTTSITISGSARADFYAINSSGSGTNNLSYNTIAGIAISATTGCFFGIYTTLGSAASMTISYNTIGSASANSISVSSNGTVYALHYNNTAGASAAGTFTCSNNTIQQFNLSNTGNSVFFSGIYVGTNTSGSGAQNNLISYNTISNITSASSFAMSTFPSVSGIYMTIDNGSSNHQIFNNQISNLTNTNTGNISNLICGIYCDDVSQGLLFSKNKITEIGNYCNGSGIIAGIYDYAFSSARPASTKFYNNIIILNNNTQTNLVNIYGICVFNSSSSSTAAPDLIHNTLKIFGSVIPASGVVGSSAYYLNNGNPGSPIVKNNLFINNRSGGNNFNFAFQQIKAAPNGTFDYNYLEATDNSAKCVHWGSSGAGNDYTYSAWVALGIGAHDKNGTLGLDADGLPYASTLIYRTGTNLSGTVPNDYNGISRPTLPTMGAYELFINPGNVSPSTVCVGNTFNLSYTLQGNYNSGNIFTAQLSDYNGSFTSAISIGSTTATTSGTISCTIPYNMVAGSGYLIRVVANNPALTGNNSNTLIIPANGGLGTWTWTGTYNTDWFNGCNWDMGTLPDLQSTVIIPGGTTNNPSIQNHQAYCKTIQINTSNGGHLTINSTSGGKLNITP